MPLQSTEDHDNFHFFKCHSVGKHKVELHSSVTAVFTCSCPAVVAFFLKIFFRQQQQIPTGMPSSKSRAMSGFPSEKSWWSAVGERQRGTWSWIYTGGLEAMRDKNKNQFCWNCLLYGSSTSLQTQLPSCFCTFLHLLGNWKPVLKVHVTCHYI